MTIYKDAKNYAELTMMNMEEAEIRCGYFLNLRKKKVEAMEQAKTCPECKESTLSLEPVSVLSDEPNSNYMEAQCENEECQYYCEDYPYPKLIDKFDVVLMYALQVEREGIAQVEKQIGSPWNEFVAEDTAQLV